MKYIVAVSGGVDSVVLLHMMFQINPKSIVVAHFDHGIRPDSAEDAEFVRQLAKKYNLPFELKREELGSQASEAFARERRYEFLNNLARHYNARIVTAHHLDDIVETIALNFTRGTGWRGLASMGSQVVRPLIDIEKSRLISYAKANGIEWREDSTNQTDKYLRNRIRHKSSKLPTDTKRQLRALHATQHQLRKQIDEEARKLIGDGPEYSRYQFINMGDAAAINCLWVVFSGQLTRPQLKKVLHMVKTAKPGAVLQAGSGQNVHFTSRKFIV